MAQTKNITVQLDRMAVLGCRIKFLLSNSTVSWIRRRDLGVLTVGRFTFTKDDRFKAIHQPGSEDWLLKIHYAQHRDAGAYMCQTSTSPSLSTAVWLTVVETRVLGGPDLDVNSGSTINLTCIVKQSPDPPPFIFWYHEREPLTYDSPRGGIKVVKEHGPTSSSSRVLIHRATPKDAGRYACHTANSEPHHIVVHIVHSEYPSGEAEEHRDRTTGTGKQGEDQAL
ncbi:basement membrane-specific heparan sulfate proteoglycan core protein-like [Eriocheir sinensis]|uniref:basement membrane-specific heparan sulfate proteoglycan core protein-like n=1 Tax=Eriocheir sinensis TaxID=95602 RepID=UPI0021C77BAD|nr:basement membrane-specific heparan sulfate proteoglycan core protein-like [Eriocheir sinensis]